MRPMIPEIVKNNLCTGCGTCSALCPKKAIEMVLNENKGIYVPQLNDRNCNNCGLCYKICPGYEIDIKGLNLELFGKKPENTLVGNYLSCYIGHTTDYNIRYNSASGGLITAILIFSLEEGLIDGALVTRMKKDRPFEPEPFIARTKEEIIEASKSKYCPVPANIALHEIIQAQEGTRFAVVGLPCHIHGLRKAQKVNAKLRDRVKLCLGIFCAHTDSFLATKFILNRFGIETKDVKRVEYRGRGWPGSMMVELYNEDIKIIPFKDYIKIFHSYNFFTPRRCLLCNDATCELADITFGDAWDIPDLKNSKIGYSVLINRIKYGKKILQDMNDNKKIDLIEIPIKNIILSQRGLMYTKKIGFKFRTAILKLIGKQLPDINTNFPKSDGFIPFDAMLPYLNTHLSMNGLTLKLLKYTPYKILYYYGSISNGMAFLWLQFWIFKQRGNQ